MEGLHWLAAEAKWFGFARGPLFVFNLTLAFVPVVLAYLLFRPERSRTALWWCGAVTFVLFLPNAAYVLTDGIHLITDIRRIESHAAIYTIYVPGYVAFFVAGFTFYVLALRRLEEYVRATWTAVPWWPMWIAIQGLVATGVYLGRVVRLNSWHVVTRPTAVLDGIESLGAPAPMVLIGLTTMAFAVGTLAWRPAVDAGASVARAASRRTAQRIAASDW